MYRAIVLHSHLYIYIFLSFFFSRLESLVLAGVYCIPFLTSTLFASYWFSLFLSLCVSFSSLFVLSPRQYMLLLCISAEFFSVACASRSVLPPSSSSFVPLNLSIVRRWAYVLTYEREVLHATKRGHEPCLVCPLPFLCSLVRILYVCRNIVRLVRSM